MNIIACDKALGLGRKHNITEKTFENKLIRYGYSKHQIKIIESDIKNGFEFESEFTIFSKSK